MNELNARRKCPKCGCYCSQIVGYGSESRGLFKVVGRCKAHGVVDLTQGDWAWEDFFGDEGTDG